MKERGDRPNGLKVGTQYGEEAKDLLISLDLLDGSKKIAKCNEKLIFPFKMGGAEVLSRRLDPGFELVVHRFESRETRPKSIRTALSHILSEDQIVELGSSYDIVGHVLIIELVQALMEKKREIGEALLSWLPVDTVALKTFPTSGVKRVKGFEVIAGSPSLETTHKENGLQFRLDLTKVFFNPRLGAERHRVAGLCRNSAIVIDMFAGVGPFSITISRMSGLEGAKIYAIDSNEDAIGYLLHNVRLNRAWKVTGILGDSCMETPRIARKVGKADDVIMNLPGSSNLFLPAAAASLKIGGMIHYYRLAPKVKARKQIEDELGSAGSFKIKVHREVESYSPSKSIFVTDAVLTDRH